ncbi:HNH endonuclease [Nocardia sp. ET3-3]|uniref:HNH endonuclease n=1 Tax=Nocardia terrae TaxID=2675851 RepID=A0A7K1VAI4_9NOCA|nr:HNH endonuclease [Nocardia terrae]
MARTDTGHRRHRRNRERLKRLREPCHLCDEPIDYSIPYPHPDSFEADHVKPVSKGGYLFGELRASHKRCNTARGNRSVDEYRDSIRVDCVDRFPTSREW